MNILTLLRLKKDVAWIQDDSTIRQALEKCKAHGYTAVPIIDAYGKYVGTVNEGDFLRAILDKETTEVKELENHPVREIIRPSFNPALSWNANIEDILEGIMSQNFVPIVDDRNVFMGIITRKTVISNLMKELEERK